MGECAACAVELPFVWRILATSEFAILSGAIMVLIAFLRKKDIGEEGEFAKNRLLSIFGVGAAFYTFGVLVASEMVVHGPAISALISNGFGDQRVGWLLTAVVFDSLLRLYKELFWRPRVVAR